MIYSAQLNPSLPVKCTHTCGKGVRHRRITCHRVNVYSWIDPDPVPHGCNDTIKPSDFQSCVINANCNSKVLWKVGPWSPVFEAELFQYSHRHPHTPTSTTKGTPTAHIDTHNHTHKHPHSHIPTCTKTYNLTHLLMFKFK